MVSDKRDLISKIAALHEDYVDGLAAEGSPIAPILFLSAPWLLNQIGPVIEPRRLAKIRRATLKNGILRPCDQQDRKNNWITSSQQLRRAFLSHVITSDASTFLEVVDSCILLFSTPRSPRPASQTRPKHSGSPLKPLTQELVDHLNTPPERAWRLLGHLIEDLNGRAWSEAFRSGRILVYRDYREDWELLPPEIWEDSPPFQLNMEISDIRNRFLPDVSERSVPRSEVEQCESRGLAIDVMTSPLAPPSYALRGNINYLREPLDEEGTYRFLLSRDLPPNVFMPGRSPPLREMLDTTLAARRWFRGAIRDARRLGQRPSQKEVQDKLTRIGVSKDQAEDIYATQRPKKWGVPGRIPKPERYIIPDISDT